MGEVSKTMVLSLGAIGAVHFARVSHSAPPVRRATYLANFLGGRVGAYLVLGSVAGTLGKKQYQHLPTYQIIGTEVYHDTIM